MKKLPAMQEMQVQSLGREDPLEKATAAHSSILAWEIPRAEEPGGLQSMGSQSQTRLRLKVVVLITKSLRLDFRKEENTGRINDSLPIVQLHRFLIA